MLFRRLYYLAKTWNTPWLNAEKLERLQNKKLRFIIRYSYKYVPFYRRTWKKNGIDPEHIKTKEDLKGLPIITKEIVRENWKEFVASGFDRNNTKIKSTSGSTGRSLDVLYDYRANDFSDALAARGFYSIGFRPGYKWAYSLPDPEVEKKFYYISKNVFIPSTMHERDQIDLLKKTRPDFIISFPTTLSIISKIIKEEGIEGISPKIIMAWGEPLYKDRRRLIESCFGEKVGVFEYYGAVEFSQMALECEKHNGMHMYPDNIVMELLKGNENVGQGENGDITLTGLNNRAMPLIRYKIGDNGSFDQNSCECGRNFPLIGCVEGRKDEFITLPSGRILGPRLICGAFDEPVFFNSKVSDFNLVQKKKDKIVINVTKGKNYTKDTIKIIDRFMNDLIMEPMSIEINVVESIPKTGSGKTRRIRSKVKTRI